MNKKIIQAFFVTLVLVSAMGCEKWRNNRETLTSEDHTLAEACFNDILRNCLLATSPVGELLTDSCFTIQKNGTTFPQTVTIDFGNTGCESVFGTLMQGRIIILLTDSLTHPGATATFTPDELYNKGYRIDGVLILEVTGINSLGYPEFDITVEDGIITAEENRTGEAFIMDWTCSYHYDLIERSNLTFILDDLYLITGKASGTNREGRNFRANITTPLKKYVGCRWPGTGITNIAPDELKERDLSYGDCEPGSTCCDNVAKEIVKWPDQTVEMR